MVTFLKPENLFIRKKKNSILSTPKSIVQIWVYNYQCQHQLQKTTRKDFKRGSQFYIWLPISSLEILAQINEILMTKGMFLTFWLRTKNDYFNVKSELTENFLFKREIKTEFVQGKDGLISGKFSKATVLAV